MFTPITVTRVTHKEQRANERETLGSGQSIKPVKNFPRSIQPEIKNTCTRG